MVRRQLRQTGGREEQRAFSSELVRPSRTAFGSCGQRSKVMFQKSSRSRGPGIVLTFVAAATLVVGSGLPAGAVPLDGPISSATTFSARSLVATGLYLPVGVRVRAAQNDLLVGQASAGNVVRVDLST